MKAFLVRHGESEKNVRKIVNSTPHMTLPLTERGREQAAHAANALRGRGAQLIVTSPLPRAKETAQIIAHELGIPLREDARLNEIDNGVYEGGTEPEYRAYLDHKLDNRHRRTPEGGEPFDALLERVGAALRDCKREGYEHVVIVSHGHPVEAAIRVARNIAYDEHVPLAGNCEICEVDV
jgi:probable phosphoglycerate mutase